MGPQNGFSKKWPHVSGCLMANGTRRTLAGAPKATGAAASCRGAEPPRPCGALRPGISRMAPSLPLAVAQEGPNKATTSFWKRGGGLWKVRRWDWELGSWINCPGSGQQPKDYTFECFVLSAGPPLSILKRAAGKTKLAEKQARPQCQRV